MPDVVSNSAEKAGNVTCVTPVVKQALQEIKPSSSDPQFPNLENEQPVPLIHDESVRHIS